MKLRTLLAGGACLGLLAAANAALARRAGDLEAPLPGEGRTYRWRGMDVAYTAAGDPDDPAVVLLHGVNAAATSREFEPIAGRLAEDHHVLAPDLPGFGRSDRPPIEYDADLYVDFVGDFVGDLAPGAAGVASSLSGSYAVLAARDRGVFSRLALICPTATTLPIERPRRELLFRSPLVGTALYNLVVSKPAIRYFNHDHGYADPARLDDETVEYQWRTAHQPGARFAPAAFVSGGLDPSVNLADAIADLDVPVTLFWGREAELTPLSYGHDLAEAADARLLVFDDARLLPHVEHPDAFLDALREALPRAQE